MNYKKNLILKINIQKIGILMKIKMQLIIIRKIKAIEVRVIEVEVGHRAKVERVLQF